MANPPAGWYPNPEKPSEQRYWDGEQWTDHTAPAAGSSSPSPSEQPGEGDAYWGQVSGQQPSWTRGCGSRSWRRVLCCLFSALAP